ncbi:MAG: trigger factor [Thermoleophilia bacterium]|nr:trigger factor [Thermoleophilia bacterium]
MIAVAALLVLGYGVNLFDSGSSQSPFSAGAGADATEAVFEVTGSAANGVDITYGNDTSNYQGSQPPFYKTLAVRDSALYYALTAQLQGGGRITCKLTIGDAVSVGHASGGYNICSAQLNGDFDGGWR